MNSAGNIDFENRLQSWIDSINAEIKKSLDDILPHAPGREHPFIGRVYDHIYEYLENGGKRMHGISILLSYRVAGGNNLDMILPVAAAFQLYHHHTLIHDDIYDEDMKRRGFATAHHAFSNYFLRKHGTANGDAASAVFNSPSRRKGVIAGFALGKIVHAIAFELIAKAGIPAEALHILRKINLHDLADNAAQLKDVYHEGSSITSP
jgi:geranylgeranyl diphosphate synthase type I